MITLLSLLITLVGFIVVYLVRMIWKSYLAKHELLKKSPHLPCAPGANLIFGHTGLFETQKHNVLKFHKYHKQLGHTYALFNQQMVSVSTTDIELVKNINLDHIDKPRTSSPFDELSLDSIDKAEGQKWARIRRAIAPALSAHKIKSPESQTETSEILDKLVEMINIKITKFSIDACDGAISAEINLDEFISRLTFEFVVTNFFKHPNQVKFVEENEYWVEKGLYGVIPAFMAPDFGFLLKFPMLHPVINWFVMSIGPCGVLPRTIKKFTIEAARLYGKARREAEIENKNDTAFDFKKVKLFELNDGTKFVRKTLDYILDRLYDGTLNFTEYVHSVRFLHYAAERTLCDVIIGVIHNLSLHPDVQKKLRLSLATEGVESQYMNWIIKETIRLHPPVPKGGSRTIKRDVLTKEGLLIPSGTHVYPSVYTIHRLKEYWGEDAEEFRPERWENEKNFDPGQFLGFGLGKRNCPGKEIAFVQISRIIERLIMKFKFEKSDKSPTLSQFTSPFLLFTITDNPVYVNVVSL